MQNPDKDSLLVTPDAIGGYNPTHPNPERVLMKIIVRHSTYSSTRIHPKQNPEKDSLLVTPDAIGGYYPTHPNPERVLSRKDEIRGFVEGVTKSTE